MVKKKFDLSKDMILSNKEINDLNINIDEARKEKDEYETITLRIKKTIKKEFKLWCVQNNVQMNDAFIEAWLILKNR